MPAKQSILILMSWFLGNLAIHLITPALPMIATAFDCSTRMAQLSISFFLLGKAVSVAFWGPLSEKKGRKPLFLTGLLLFSLANALSVVSTHITLLLICRFLQGAAVGATLLMGRAMVNDSHNEQKATRQFAFYFSAAGVIICFLPMLGAFLNQHFGWRSGFLLMALYSLLLLAIAPIKETHQPQSSSSEHSWQSTVSTLFKNPLYLGYLLVSALMMAGESAFNTSAAFILMQTHHLSLHYFGLVKTAMLLAHLAGTLMCGFLVSRVLAEQLVGIGVKCFLLAAAIMISFQLVQLDVILSYILPMLLYFFGTGFIVSSSTAAMVRPFPNNMATALGFSLFIQFSLSALFSAISALTVIETTQPFLGLLAAISFCAWFTWRRLIAKANAREITLVKLQQE